MYQHRREKGLKYRMCGRFALYTSATKLQFFFGTRSALDLKPRYNIAPSQPVPVVLINEAGERVFNVARWGWIPSWVRNPKDVKHPIHVEIETAAIKPLYRRAFRTRRILIPADAFYEWEATSSGKRPWLIRLKDGEPMGIGGLLERSRGPDGEILSFSLLTTEPNPLVAKIHDRMPVIIPPEDYSNWLDPAFTDVTRIQMIAKPYPERLMESYLVSHEINNPLHDSAELIAEKKGDTGTAK